MDKKLGFGLLGLLALATLVFLVSGLMGGPESKPASGAAGQGDEATAQGSASSAKPVVGREQLRDPAEADAGSIALPGALPALRGVQAGQPGDAKPPALPHGQLELEGDVQEAEAEAAIKAMWAPIRDCYAELRQRAPQARGRMLMTFKVRPGEAGQAATGELFLKETQFTDPKYLTCVRAAIDNARFPAGRNVQGSVTVPLFLAPQDVGENP